SGHRAGRIDKSDCPPDAEIGGGGDREGPANRYAEETGARRVDLRPTAEVLECDDEVGDVAAANLVEAKTRRIDRNYGDTGSGEAARQAFEAGVVEGPGLHTHGENESAVATVCGRAV